MFVKHWPPARSRWNTRSSLHLVHDETKSFGSIPSPHPVYDETKSFVSTPLSHPLDATAKNLTW